MELELRLDPDDASRLSRLKLLASATRGGRTQPRRIVWHDSPDCALTEHGMALARERGVWRLEKLVPSATDTWAPGAPPPVLAEAAEVAELGIRPAGASGTRRRLHRPAPNLRPCHGTGRGDAGARPRFHADHHDRTCGLPRTPVGRCAGGAAPGIGGGRGGAGAGAVRHAGRGSAGRCSRHRAGAAPVGRDVDAGTAWTLPPPSPSCWPI